MRNKPQIGDRIQARDGVIVEGADVSYIYFTVTNVLEYRTPGQHRVAVTARTDLGDEFFLLLDEFVGVEVTS